MNFGIKFAQKGYFRLKIEKVNITIEFCIFELVQVLNFRAYTDNFGILDPDHIEIQVTQKFSKSWYCIQCRKHVFICQLLIVRPPIIKDFVMRSQKKVLGARTIKKPSTLIQRSKWTSSDKNNLDVKIGSIYYDKLNSELASS